MSCYSVSDSVNTMNNDRTLYFKEECKNLLGPVLYIPYYIYSKTCQGYVKYIGKNSLNGFTKITDVTIQEGIEDIYDYAFANCPNLSTVQIPASLYTIGTDVFSGSNQVILIFPSVARWVEFANLNPIKAIIYYRTYELKILNDYSGPIIPIYANKTSLIIAPEGSNIDVRPLSEIGAENEITSYGELVDKILNKKSSATNKNIPTCQKSKSPLNLLLITQMTIKN